jgi:hypothetical protein
MVNEWIEIEVPVAQTDAFTYVAENYFENHHRWNPAIIELTKLTDGPVGVGTRGRETRRFVVKQPADFEVTAYDPPHHFAFTNTTGAFALDRSYTFEPAPAGTLITVSMQMGARKPIARVLLPIVGGTIGKQVRSNIARLRDLLSAEAASPSPP